MEMNVYTDVLPDLCLNQQRSLLHYHHRRRHLFAMADSIHISGNAGDSISSDSSSDEANNTFEEENHRGYEPETPLATDIDEGAPSDSDWDDSSDDITVYGSGLSRTYYHPAECLEAINGRAVPSALMRYPGEANKYDETIATARGIRHSLEFAQSPAVLELCRTGSRPLLRRARNARLIMSDIIPDDLNPSDETIPYCIWYPDVASEETYKELACRFPELRYHVGRACAVAGYTGLYRQLGLLPDVSIAEEARDNGSMEIFEDIISSPVRYRVMDDYTNSVNLSSPQSPAFLNADTAVRSTLKKTTSLQVPLGGSRHQHFNITDDFNVADVVCRERSPTSVAPDAADVTLLYSPLPADLPALTVDKDMLILMAAFEGNIDRYARLRRPYPIKGETHCVVRGIYHNTSFAKWWEDELARGKTLGKGSFYIEKAIAARHIMNNDVGYVLSLGERGPFPYMIWYPRPPMPQTLRFLAARRPQMNCQLIQACIHAGYKELYDELKERIEPRHLPYLLKEAQLSSEPYFREDVERRVREGGVDIRQMSHARDMDEDGSYILDARRESHFEESTLTLPSSPAAVWVSEGLSCFSEPCGPYSGIGLDASAVELYISVPERMKRAAWESGTWLSYVDGLWEDFEEGVELVGEAVETAPGN